MKKIKLETINIQNLKQAFELIDMNISCFVYPDGEVRERKNGQIIHVSNIHNINLKNNLNRYNCQCTLDINFEWNITKVFSRKSSYEMLCKLEYDDTTIYIKDAFDKIMCSNDKKRFVEKLYEYIDDGYEYFIIHFMENADKINFWIDDRKFYKENIVQVHNGEYILKD